MGSTHTPFLFFTHILFPLRLQGREVELVCRCAFFLLKVHQNQIVANRSMLLFLVSLKEHTRGKLQSQEDLMGFNRAALGFLKRTLDVEVFLPDETRAKKPKSTKGPAAARKK